MATWNTRRLPTRLTPGWTNRLFVATHGHWRGYFPLSGDVFWNPRDVAAPYALIVDPGRWTPIGATPCPSFRGWRYLDTPPGGAPEVAPYHDADDHATEDASIPHALREGQRDHAPALLPPPPISLFPPPAVTPTSHAADPALAARGAGPAHARLHAPWDDDPVRGAQRAGGGT